MSNSPFLNSIRTDMRQKGYALKTEKTYLHWIKRFILFHKKRHPQTMGSEEVRLFLSSLANSRHVAINTQKIALNAPPSSQLFCPPTGLWHDNKVSN